MSRRIHGLIGLLTHPTYEVTMLVQRGDTGILVDGSQLGLPTELGNLDSMVMQTMERVSYTSRSLATVNTFWAVDIPSTIL